MKITVLFILIFSIPIMANELDWSLENIKQYKSYNKRDIQISGKLIYFKKYIRARDNFYKLKISNDTDKRFVEVVYYSIRRLQRVNYFNCEEGFNIEVKGTFRYQPKKNRIGTIIIKDKAKHFACSKDKDE